MKASQLICIKLPIYIRHKDVEKSNLEITAAAILAQINRCCYCRRPLKKIENCAERSLYIKFDKNPKKVVNWRACHVIKYVLVLPYIEHYGTTGRDPAAGNPGPWWWALLSSPCWVCSLWWNHVWVTPVCKTKWRRYRNIRERMFWWPAQWIK